MEPHAQSFALSVVIASPSPLDPLHLPRITSRKQKWRFLEISYLRQIELKSPRGGCQPDQRLPGIRSR